MMIFTSPGCGAPGCKYGKANVCEFGSLSQCSLVSQRSRIDAHLRHFMLLRGESGGENKRKAREILCLAQRMQAACETRRRNAPIELVCAPRKIIEKLGSRAVAELAVLASGSQPKPSHQHERGKPKPDLHKLHDRMLYFAMQERRA